MDGPEVGEVVAPPGQMARGADDEVDGEQQAELPGLERCRQVEAEAGSGVRHGRRWCGRGAIEWYGLGWRKIKKAAEAAFFDDSGNCVADQPRR